MAWADKAACIGKSDLFFSDHLANTVKKAKAVCATCAVISECREYAMANFEFGVWGGMTANERRVAKRKPKTRRTVRLHDTNLDAVKSGGDIS